MGAWVLALTLVFLHYGRLGEFFVPVLLFEPVFLGSSGVRKPQ